MVSGTVLLDLGSVLDTLERQKWVFGVGEVLFFRNSYVFGQNCF